MKSRSKIFPPPAFHLFEYTKQVNYDITQPAITCSKLTIETLDQGVKYVQS